MIQETRAHVVVMVTSADEAEATRLARILVEGRLAACVQIVPIRSIFIWQGQLNDDREQLLLIKTRTDQLDRIRDTITHHHSYDVPEITVLPLLMGSAAYLGWIDEVVAEL
jgi:periplasmic divalent cation tolerance protein